MALYDPTTFNFDKRHSLRKCTSSLPPPPPLNIFKWGARRPARLAAAHPDPQEIRHVTATQVECWPVDRVSLVGRAPRDDHGKWRVWTSTLSRSPGARALMKQSEAPIVGWCANGSIHTRSE
ncbi:hypothetical protein H4582DRAFT_2062534 [Lactarius indigo]|nr:hypothetical protein H4582DRAFT_2062534 [Lactarius indigo]